MAQTSTSDMELQVHSYAACFVRSLGQSWKQSSNRHCTLVRATCAPSTMHTIETPRRQKSLPRALTHPPHPSAKPLEAVSPFSPYAKHLARRLDLPFEFSPSSPSPMSSLVVRLLDHAQAHSGRRAISVCLQHRFPQHIGSPEKPLGSFDLPPPCSWIFPSDLLLGLVTMQLTQPDSLCEVDHYINDVPLSPPSRHLRPPSCT